MILARHLQNTAPWLGDLSRLFDAAFQRFTTPYDGFRFLADDQGWTLELDLPGVKRDAIQLDVKDQQLHLAIDHEGSFANRARYQLPLAKQIEVSAITANLADGVLSIHLPRKAPVGDTAKRIEIL